MYDTVLEHIRKCKKALPNNIFWVMPELNIIDSRKRYLRKYMYRMALNDAERALHELRRAEEAYNKVVETD